MQFHQAPNYLQRSLMVQETLINIVAKISTVNMSLEMSDFRNFVSFLTFFDMLQDNHRF